jgi:hypothetical protein
MKNKWIIGYHFDVVIKYVACNPAGQSTPWTLSFCCLSMCFVDQVLMPLLLVYRHYYHRLPGILQSRIHIVHFLHFQIIFIGCLGSCLFLATALGSSPPPLRLRRLLPIQRRLALRFCFSLISTRLIRALLPTLFPLWPCRRS